jgi:hypothetical protein
MEQQGQAEQQPSIMDRMQSIADQQLVADGKLVIAKEPEPAEPEAPAAPATPVEAEAPAETPPEEQPQPQRFKLKVKAEDGSDVEVEEDLEGLKKGYMLEKAFRQKTSQLARAREEVDKKVKEATDAKLKELSDKLTFAEQAIWHTLAPEMQSTDWNKLAAEDPAEWAKRYQHVQNVNAKLSQVQAERRRIEEARANEQKGALQKQIAESVEELQRDIPNWGQEVYSSILKTGKEYGYKLEELNAIVDPRAIKVLHDAMQYRALKAKPIADKKVAPEAPKVMKPGVTEKTDPKAEKWEEARKRQRKTGSRSDTLDVLSAMLEREGVRGING